MAHTRPGDAPDHEPHHGAAAVCRFELLANNEYATDDVNLFTDLATSRRRVRTLRGATRNRPDSSERYREMFVPNGLESELRAALVDGGSCWGGLIFARGPGQPDFSAEETGFLSRLSGPLARGMRSSILTTAAHRERGPDAPGLHGSRMADASDQVTVIIALATPLDVVALLLGAYGLTAREREVADLVLRGQSTAQVSAALFIAPYTVQDHLKAIFEKVGVHSRKDLMHQVFFEHFLPRITDHAIPAANGMLL